jgi:hypothetical protein
MAQIILVNEKMWSGLERAQPHKVRVKNNDTKWYQLGMLYFQNNRMTQEKMSKQSLPPLKYYKNLTGHVFQIENSCGHQYQFFFNEY